MILLRSSAAVMVIMAWLLFCGYGQEDHGLESAQPVGAFLDGVFPIVTPGPTGSWELRDAFPNTTFVDPVRVVAAPNGEDTIYVVCRNGEIWKMPDDPGTTASERVRFLDRRSQTWGFGDSGMMSLAFHPEFGQAESPNRGYCYVFYQYTLSPGNQPITNPSAMRLSRFTVPEGSEAVDPDSEYVMIQQFDRHNWHNGGQLFFGADRFLYLVVGDEGAADDSYDVTQKLDDRLFSGILRLDVDQDPARGHPIRRQPRSITRPADWPASFTQGYFIPHDNPWQDPSGGILEEFWTLGLRSPHSMHHDAATGNIWIAEVGQVSREEITVARKGGNHQWPFKEGFLDGPRSRPATVIGTENPPIFDYGRGQGGCVIGGMIYRGTEHAGSLTGKYIFGDHNTRKLWALTHVPGEDPEIEYLTSVFRSGGIKRGLSGISPSSSGECYVCELGDTGRDTGKIYRLSRSGTAAPDPPALLSQTGAFTDLEALTPRPGLLPYGINAPFWSDNAKKRRWIAIPNDGSHNTATEQIRFSERGNWDFPVGTVMVKHFDMPVDERNPNVVRRLETRFLVKGSDDKFYGLTYRWNAEGTDAVLLTAGASEAIEITQANGSSRQQEWVYPSRADCLTCHTANAGHVLGLRTHQLNRDQFFPETNRSDHLLRAWNHIGLFSPAIVEADIPGFLKSAGMEDTSRPLVDRVRSWLDSNCSQCHQPGGVEANFDARFTTPLAQQGLLHGSLRGSHSTTDALVVSPGDLTRSLLYQRANSLEADAMPPLAKNLVDENAMAVMAEWIQQLDDDQTAPLIGHYYSGTNFDSLLLTRVDANIDFTWGAGSPSSEIPVNQFSVRWEGTVVPQFSETYRFYTETDDGVRLWIDDQLIVNRWVDQAATEVSGTISLVAGVPAKVRMEYYENGGSAVARLSWSGPRTPKEPIPASAFAAEGVDAPSVALAAANAFVSGPFDVSVNFSRPVSGLTASELEVSNGTVTALTGQGTAYLARVTPHAHGEVTVFLPEDAAFDANGRGNAASNVVAVTYEDNDPPSVVLITTSNVVTGAFAVEAAFSESVQGFTAAEVTVSNGTLTDFSANGGGASYTFTVTPSTAGEVAVVVPQGVATDAAGNGNMAATTLVVDYLPHDGPATVRVFLLAGQSNMSGQGRRESLPPALNGPQPDVDFYYRIPGGEDVFTVLQPGSSDGVDFGPELTLGQTLAKSYQSAEPGTRVALIKYARGGSRLYADWAPGEEEVLAFHQVADNGVARLADAYPQASIEVSGFFWQQGEGDAMSGQAGNYGANLTEFIDAMRARYGPGLPFIYGRLSSNQVPAIGEQESVRLRQAQESVDGLDAMVKMLDTDGLDVIASDPIHFNVEGLLDLGIAFAEGLLTVNQVPLAETSVTLSSISTDISGPFQAGVASSRPLSGLAVADFIVTNGTALELTGSSREFSLTVSPENHGEVTVQLPAGAAGDPLGRGQAQSNRLNVTYTSEALVDALEDVTLPDTVRRGEDVPVSLRYQAAGLRDVQILLHDSQEGWRVDASHFARVSPGAGSMALDLPVAPGARLGSGYLWAVRLIPAGSNYTQSVAGFYQEATVLENTGGNRFDSIDRFSAPAEVERGQSVVVEMDYRAIQTRDVELLLQDSQDNWRTVGSAPAQVTTGSGIRIFNITIAADARIGEGYVWVNRLLPVGGDNTQAVAEAYVNASVLPSSTGSAEQDLIHAFSAPPVVYRARTARVSVDYEASAGRDLNVILLDSENGWQVVGQGRAGVVSGTGRQEFTIGMASDGRIGSGYVWVAQLLPTGATGNSNAFDEKYVSATMEEAPDAGALVNYAVLPESSATQSSVYGFAFGAGLARDGNADGDWRNGSVTHTEQDTNAWWEIDLGSSKFIDHVFVWNRTDCCGERLADFYVLVSDEPFASTGLESSIAQPGVRSVFVSGSPDPTVRAEVGRTGRYVRVQLSGTGYLSLAEVEILGSLGGQLVNGLTYHYYEGVWDSLPEFDTLPARSTGTVTNVSLDPRRRDDYFALRFRGCLNVPTAGDYTFYTASAAGSRLFINEQLIVDNDGDHGLEERSGTVFLPEGLHPTEIQYFATEGTKALAVSWEGPGISKETIPGNAFSVNETGVSPSFRFSLPQRSAGDNTDGDMLDLAAEYALGQNPFDGRVADAGLRLDVQPDAIHVFYDRPPGLNEYRYVLEASADLQSWFEILGSEIMPPDDGRERVIYRRLEKRWPLSRETGFVRLRMQHRAWDHVSYTPVSGWQETRLFPGHQTYGQAFVLDPVFAGSVAAVKGDRLVAGAGGLAGLLPAGGRFYLQFSSGTYEGHYLEIDAVASSDQVLVVDYSARHSTLASVEPDQLTGNRFVVYEHRTIEQLFPKELFAGSKDPGLADQILFFDGVKYQGVYLLDAAGRYQWTNVGDSGLENQDNRPVPSGTGCFIKRGPGAGEVTLVSFGQLRNHASVQPLRKGYNLLGPSAPLWQSPEQRGLTSGNGFSGSQDPSEADQIHVWDGANASFKSLFYFTPPGGVPYWTPIDDTRLENHDDRLWFAPGAAFFLRLAEEPIRAYRVPNPIHEP